MMPRSSLQDKSLSDYFDEGAKQAKSPKVLANWIITELLRELNDRNIPFEKNPVPVSHLVELVELVSEAARSPASPQKRCSRNFSQEERLRGR